MRKWTRAAVLTICGGPCQQTIKPGASMLVLEIPGLKAARVRCVACAGEPAPIDLPPLKLQAPISPMVKLPSGAGALPFDWKARSSGERQPGEDG